MARTKQHIPCSARQYRTFHFIIIVLIIFGIQQASFAQQTDSISPDQKTDTVKKDFVTRVQEMVSKDAQKSISDFQKEKDNIRQQKLIEELQKTMLKAKIFLKHGIDTLKIHEELEHSKAWLTIAGDGVLVNKGDFQTHRNLTTTYKILLELLSRSNTRKTELDNYESNLLNYRYIIDSLNSDTTLYDFPDDSVALMRFVNKYAYVAQGMQPTDSALKKAIEEVQALQTKVNFEAYQINASIEEVEGYQKELSAHFLNRKFHGLSDLPKYPRPLSETLNNSVTKGQLAFSFYATQHLGKITVIILLIIASSVFLSSLKKILTKENLIQKDFAGQLVLRYPILSAIVIVLNLFQFILPDPPFIFNLLFWIVPSMALTIIFWNFITKYWQRFWLIMLTLFILACLNNLILQPYTIERWVMLLLSLIGIAVGLFFIFGRHKKELREKLIVFFIALAVMFEVFAVFTNITGRYNLSKSMFIAGYFNVIIGILFLWTVRLINEGLAMASRVYTKQDKKLFYVNFDRVGGKAPALLYILLVIGWFVLLGRNFYEYRMISEPLKNFVLSERTVGNYTFTINNIIIFFMIMAIAVISSRIISFFASDIKPSHGTNPNERKAGLGSWLLLIRVTIISIGLFMALAASGFPMDRITILLGALGVGVGLGLQGLVNNLVSGLIIAFEKPVNVGDVVEISGQVGTMKSIGFRSSVIASSNGANVVIPNGDLLNAHLINWTLGGNKRLLEIVVHVAYGTDLNGTQKILLELLNTNEQVLKYPSPLVQFQGFESSSIAAKITFWVADYRIAAHVKSEMIASVDEAFRSHNIVIPFPQQDIHIYNDPKREPE